MADLGPRIAAAALLLGGCSGVADYRPVVGDVVDPAALASDQAGCLAIAQAYKPGLDLTGIGQAAADGAGRNAAGAAINPLVPVLGAAGAAGAALLDDIGLPGAGQKRVFLLCLDHRGQRSGAYSVMDPSL